MYVPGRLHNMTTLAAWTAAEQEEQMERDQDDVAMPAMPIGVATAQKPSIPSKPGITTQYQT